LLDLQQSIKHWQNEVSTLQVEREKLFREIRDQEQRLVAHQTSEFDALQKLEQSSEVIENLRVERDSARKICDNQKTEIARLEKKMNKLNEDHLERCKQIAIETQEKTQYMMNSLQEEVKHCHLDNAHLKAQLDRAEREKK
jgi:predicted HicB family RNase H-like nuclease